MKLLLEKIKEATYSILPLSLIIILFSFTPIYDLSAKEILIFLICAIISIIGIALFNLGVDTAMQPMGEQIGSSLMKTKKIWIILAVCFVMGLLVTIAEPDLSVLANQMKDIFVGKTFLMCFIGIGVGLFLVISILKIILKKDLSMILIFSYLVIFAFACLAISSGNANIIPFSFDAGGATTGPITVPFLIALGVGIATTVGGRNQKENSFGLMALCSVGPIIAILLLSIMSKNTNPCFSIDYGYSNSLGYMILNYLVASIKEVGIALGLIVLCFLIIDLIFIKLSKKSLLKIGIGIAYTFVGLILFLTAVQVGYMPVGYSIGVQLADNEILLTLFGTIIGVVVVLAEPSIRILTKQVEEITMGDVSKKSMLIALCIGVGLAIGLSMIRIIFQFSILYYLVPGYILSLLLSFFVPKMYTAIAFDSGGVASGSLTSSFLLPFAVGACMTLDGTNFIFEGAFGIAAMVALAPLITIQLLGFKSVIKKQVIAKIRTNKINTCADDEIIYFE